MWSNLKLWYQAVTGRGFQAQLEEASQLLTISLRGSEAIRRDLDVALDLINALRKASDEEKAALVEKYRQVLVSIDNGAAAAAKDGKSLIDGSGFELTLSEGNDVSWLRKLDHMRLTIDPAGLDLPVASELDNRNVLCDDAQRRIAGSVKAVNKASAQLSSIRAR